MELNTPLVVLATKFVSFNQRREVNTPYLHTANRVIKSSICVCSICMGLNFFLTWGILDPATPRSELSPLDRVLGYYSVCTSG